MGTVVISQTPFVASCVSRAKAGDRCAFFKLVKSLAPRVFSIARRITQNEDHAESVLIQTFLEAYSDLDRYREDGTFWVWLVTIAVQEAFSKLHHCEDGRPPRVPNVTDVVIREFSVWGDAPQQRLPRDHTNSILERGLQSLDPMCRTVFVLRDMEDLPVEQIAEVVGRSVPAVEVCLLRARLQLRDVVTRELSSMKSESASRREAASGLEGKGRWMTTSKSGQSGHRNEVL